MVNVNRRSVVTLVSLVALLWGLANAAADTKVLYKDEHGIRVEFTATDTGQFTRCDDPADRYYTDKKIKVWKVSLKITNGSRRRIKPIHPNDVMASVTVHPNSGNSLSYCNYSWVPNLHTIDGQDDRFKHLHATLVYVIQPGRTLSYSAFMYLYEDDKPDIFNWQFAGYRFVNEKAKKPERPQPSARSAPADQTAATASPDNPTPVARRGPAGSLLLLIDVSGSMQGAKLDSAKRAAVDTIRKALRNKSEVAILAFEGDCDDPIDRSIGFSRNEAALVAFVNGLSAEGGTPLATALEATNRFMNQHAAASSTQMILLLADGDDDCGGLDDMLRKLKQQNLLYRHETVGLEVSGNARQQLQAIATQSGGNFHSATSRNLSQVFGDAVDLMRMLDMLGNFKRQRSGG